MFAILNTGTISNPNYDAIPNVLASFNASSGDYLGGGRITDAITGKELWQVADDLPLVPASTNKVLTAAAALLTLDHQTRISTRVVAGSPNALGPIVLVGAGDPVLSAAPPGVDTWYRGSARISDLVEQVRRSGVTPTAVRLLGYGPFAAVKPALQELLTPQQPGEIQLAAVRALSVHDQPQVAAVLLQAWNSYSPGLRRVECACNALRR